MAVLVFWFSPFLCAAVPVLTVAIPLVVYASSRYCVCVSRQSERDQGTSGMMLKTGEEAADEMDNQEGKSTKAANTVVLTVRPAKTGVFSEC